MSTRDPGSSASSNKAPASVDLAQVREWIRDLREEADNARHSAIDLYAEREDETDSQRHLASAMTALRSVAIFCDAIEEHAARLASSEPATQ